MSSTYPPPPPSKVVRVLQSLDLRHAELPADDDVPPAEVAFGSKPNLIPLGAVGSAGEPEPSDP